MPATAVDIIKANFKRRRDIQAGLRTIDEGTITDQDTGSVRAYTEDETAQITAFRNELEQVDSRIASQLDMEARSQEINTGIEHLLGTVLNQGGDPTDRRTLGQKFVAAEGYEAWARQARGKFIVDMPNTSFTNVVGDATTASPGSAGTLIRPERLDRIGRDFLDRKVFLLDVLPHIPVTLGNIEYVQDTTPLADLPDKPSEVAESGIKPQAGVTFALKSEAAAVIAAWVNITRQAAADIPQVQAYLDTRLRYAIKRRADAQAINGTGVAPTLTGLLNRTGIITYAPGGAEARYRSIRHGIRLGEDKEAVYEIIVLNPADAELFDLSNDTTAGLHVLTDNAGDTAGELALRPPRTAWGLTQVRSTAIASGTALLVDPMAVAVFDREDVTAYMTDSHATNFTSNILTLMLEARIGLGVFDPPGVCKITFNGTT